MSIRWARDMEVYPFSHGPTDHVTSYTTRFRVSSTYVLDLHINLMDFPIVFSFIRKNLRVTCMIFA